MILEINVGLKEGVLDPQAKAIYNALKSLGFSNIKDVKLCKQIVLELNNNDKEQALSEAKKMSEELLANMVIEDYKINIR